MGRMRRLRWTLGIVPLLVLGSLPGCGLFGERLQSGAVYEIVSVPGNRTLSADLFGNREGAYAKLTTWDGNLNEAWRAVKQKDGTWELENLAEGRLLSLKDDSGEDNTVASAYAKSDMLPQTWRLRCVSGDIFTISSPSTGKCLQPKDGSTSVNTYVVQMQGDGDTTQQWRFIRVNVKDRTLPKLLPVTGDTDYAAVPEILKDNGTYYLVCDNRHGVGIKTSTDLITWKNAGSALSTAGGMPFAWMEQTVPGCSLWCPSLSRIGKTYFLYYAITVCYKNTSAIGVATNTTLDPKDPAYRWADGGIVLFSTETDDFNAIDPHTVVDADGQAWLVYGSAWSGIKVRRIDTETGHLADEKVYSIAARGDHAVEGAFIFRRGEYYYLIAALERTDQNYHCAIGRSKSITGPYLDERGTDMMDGGGTMLAEGKEGMNTPGHCTVLQDGDAYYLVMEYWYSGNPDAALAISTMVWDEGWPVTAMTPNLLG